VYKSHNKWPTTAKSKDLIMRPFCRAALLQVQVQEFIDTLAVQRLNNLIKQGKV